MISSQFIFVNRTKILFVNQQLLPYSHPMGKGLISRVLAVGVLPMFISFICLVMLMLCIFLMVYGAYWLYFNIMR